MTEMAEMYTLESLTKSIMTEYKIDELILYDNTKMAIRRALVRNNLLYAGPRKKNPDTGRVCRFYPESVKQEILCDKSLFDYVRSHSTSAEIRNGKSFNEYQKQIENFSEAHYASITAMNENHGDNSDPYLSDEEFRKDKIEIMLTALFERFFTPIDDDLLRNDLDIRKDTINDSHPDPDDLQALERLKNPGKYYFQSLDTDEVKDKDRKKEKGSEGIWKKSSGK